MPKTYEKHGERFLANGEEGGQKLRDVTVVGKSVLPTSASTSALQTSTSAAIIAAIVVAGIIITSILTVMNTAVEANGAFAVNIQDQHTEIVDLHFIQNVGTFTLASNLSGDEVSFDVEAGHNISVGQMLCFQEGAAFMQAEVLSVSTNTIGIDTPIDFPFTTAATGTNNVFNLNVDGSSSAQTFSISPANLQAGMRWDITRVMIVITDQTAMDTSTFGGLSVLTKGIVLRARNGNNKNVFNIKTNGDFASHSYDVTYDDRAPSGYYGIRIRTSFSGQEKRGVTIRLNRDDGDALEIIIQDDLRNLDIFHVVAQGHVVTD